MTTSDDPIRIRRDGIDRGLGYSLICSGYLVEGDRVLLAYHVGFNKWVPPGGHLEAGETFDEAVQREFREETGLEVKVISATPALVLDENASPLPGPFYVDLEREGFRIPAITQYFFVRRVSKEQSLTAQQEEVRELKWFRLSDVAGLETFEQVRVVARYALLNHPDAWDLS